MAAAPRRRHGGLVALRTGAAVTVAAATLWACLASAAAASNTTATQCDSGWKYLPLAEAGVARCYVLSSTADTRANASVGCRSRGSAELLALRTRAAVTSALALFVGDGGTASSSIVSLLDYAVYANGTVVDHNGALVADCSVCANVSLAPSRAQPACLVAGLAIGGAASANAFVQDVDCSQTHTYLCSKPPTNGASTLDVRDAMAIFCTVFILANFIFFNGYFLISDYLKNHPHRGPVSAAPAIAYGTDHAVDGGGNEIKKAPVSGVVTEKWQSEQSNPHKLQQQDAMLHRAATAASRSSAVVRNPPSARSGEEWLSAESAIVAAAASLPVLLMAPTDQTVAIVADDDYTESGAVAAAAVREATLALDRVSTPSYQLPSSSGTIEFGRSLASAKVSETAAGLASTGEEIIVRPPSSNRISSGTYRNIDGRESGTSHQSRLPQDGRAFDDPVVVSTGEETSVMQRNAASIGVAGRASSAALAHFRNSQQQQPAKLTRTMSRSAGHLR